MKNFLCTLGAIAFTVIIVFSMTACPEPSPPPNLTSLAYELITTGSNANTYRVSKGTVTSGAVVIPATHEGKPVTEIADDAFKDTSITSVSIPSSVTSIGNAAFYGCANLTDINIPTSVTSISAGMFNCCYALASITIPTGVTSIEDAAFQNCNFTSITIPSSVTSIGDWVFVGCTNLTSVTFKLGSDISNEDFGENTFPKGSEFGNTLKEAYLTGGAGMYTRASNGDTWTKHGGGTFTLTGIPAENNGKYALFTGADLFGCREYDPTTEIFYLVQIVNGSVSLPMWDLSYSGNLSVGGVIHIFESETRTTPIKGAWWHNDTIYFTNGSAEKTWDSADGTY